MCNNTSPVRTSLRYTYRCDCSSTGLSGSAFFFVNEQRLPSLLARQGGKESVTALPLQTAYWRNAPAFFGEQTYWRWLCVNHGHRTNSSNAIRKRDAYRESHFATSLHPLRPNARPGRDRGISVDGISDVLHLMSPADSSLIHPSPFGPATTLARQQWRDLIGRARSDVAARR